VCELCEHSECHNAKTNDQYDESDADGLPIASTDPGWISNLVNRRHIVQVLQVVEQVLYASISPVRITPDSAHHDRRQGRGQHWIELQNVWRVV
jgi:hypothetical protein